MVKYEPTAISVIVTSYAANGTLQMCLQSLIDQVGEGDEIIVADCSLDPPEVEAFGARLLHFSGKRSVPEMRWAALRETRNPIVAAVESRCIPDADWLGKLREAHWQLPEAVGIGGPVWSKRGSIIDDALYFCEYGNFAPPLPKGFTKDLSGANLSYKRSVLEREGDLLEKGAWETLFHLRWREEGIPLALCGAGVQFVNSMRVTTILRQRFDYGRNYAASRSVPKAIYSVLALALPVVLTWRLMRSATRAGLNRRFFRSFPMILLFNTCWSVGEMWGYMMGAPEGARIY